MSKLTCKCGHTISDVIFPSPTEGEILCEQSRETLFVQASELIANFIHEKEHGNSVNWLKKHLGNDYPTDADIQEIIQDLMDYAMQKMVLSVTECIVCGRLHVQRAPGINEYLSYLPDLGKVTSILNQGNRL